LYSTPWPRIYHRNFSTGSLTKALLQDQQRKITGGSSWIPLAYLVFVYREVFRSLAYA
jgi:hypothetical protein